jgi:hypothetical protein
MTAKRVDPGTTSAAPMAKLKTTRSAWAGELRLRRQSGERDVRDALNTLAADVGLPAVPDTTGAPDEACGLTGRASRTDQCCAGARARGTLPRTWPGLKERAHEVLSTTGSAGGQDQSPSGHRTRSPRQRLPSWPRPSTSSPDASPDARPPPPASRPPATHRRGLSRGSATHGQESVRRGAAGAGARQAAQHTPVLGTP